ncbi:MAG TPA: hypothetical protein VM143_09960 [Acidimicrobiales bacterium]|nr:hypothetical protein [Acidimicrobiales bacterium]
MAIIAAGALGAPACGLGDKAQLERRITSAPARYDGTIVSGTIAVESRLLKVPAGVGALGAAGAPGAPAGAGPSSPPATAARFPPEGVSLGTRGVGFILDLESSRAALVDAEAQPTDPKVVFDDLVLYGRRGGVPADDARPWVRLDLDELDDAAGALDPLDGRAVDALYALPPALLTDLVAGALTGSIEKRTGGALEAGSTHYAVNVSIRKALRDTRRSRYPERRRESVEDLLRLLGVVGDLHRGEVWLDAKGRLRRFRIEFRQEPLRKVEFRMIVSVDVSPSATDDQPDRFRTPRVDQVLGVDSVLRFTSTVVATAEEDETAPAGAPPPPAAPGATP